MTRTERLVVWSLAAISAGLRLAAFLHYRFDSDEQQHLHVTWGWTAGLVQYRDYFDNHTPLFHLLTAPLLALVGERSDVLLWMRVPMLLPFAAVLLATWALAAVSYDRRVAAWAVVLLSLFPPFFLKSLEFRTDNLWTAFWMIALVAIVRGTRPFVTGLLLGAALATSMKTTVLVLSLLAAALLTHFLVRQLPLRRWWEVAAGIAVIPGALLAFFVSAGAWDALVYCTVTFNTNLEKSAVPAWLLRSLFVAAMAALVALARRWRHRTKPLRFAAAIVVAVFTLVVLCFWPLVSPRDFLPMMPLVAIFAAAGVARLPHALPAYVLAALASIAALWHYTDAFENHTDWHVTMMDQTLRLTRPGEWIMDMKGETIYRRRPWYYIFERITRLQLEQGLIEDTIAEDVIRTRTYVAQADGPMWPPAGRAFMLANFLDMGRLRAAGQWIGADGRFTIAIPGEYVIVGSEGEARGTLDGVRSTGPRNLGAGQHHFQPETEGRLAVLWAPAFRRGHSPFHLRDREF